MKKLVFGFVLAAIAALGMGAGAAQADPSATLCHDVHIVVNGSDVVNDAACQVLPPS